MADVVVAVGDNCDLMYGSEVRCCVCMSAASCTFESRVKVPEIQEDGVLTKIEIQEILEMSTNPDMALPLESKYWSEQ